MRLSSSVRRTSSFFDSPSSSALATSRRWVARTPSTKPTLFIVPPSFSLQITQGQGQGVLQLPAVDHLVDHSVFLQEFTALKILGQALAYGLLDHAGASKHNGGPRLGKVEV